MKIKTNLSFVLAIFQTCVSLRRIMEGRPTPNEKRYMVYLVKTPESEVQYDAWLCGGVIVHPKFIVTSAACVEDVKFIYAIAGYREYVNGRDIYKNKCTQAKKKKLVLTCVPKIYDFQYQDVAKWGQLDIAVAQVESDYDFFDETYLQAGCDYPPYKIDINYDLKFTEPGSDAFVLGWGHNTSYRHQEDSYDYNQRLLHEASVRIVDKNICKQQMEEKFRDIIDKYMLCSLGRGRFDSEGRQFEAKKDLKEMCKCEGDACTCSSKNDKIHRLGTKGPGFCQNDHGGPLIGWVGGRPMLLGVMSVFVMTQNNECFGPYMYTSASCTGAFLDCVINEGAMLGLNCKNLRRYGFDMVKRRISWEGHPDGPAESEGNSLRSYQRLQAPRGQEFKIRPQVGLQEIGKK